MFSIHPAARSDVKALVHLAMQLWDGHAAEELHEEFLQLLDAGKAQFFLATEGNVPIGFAQCQLRHDYVEGTESSPVGYLEGIFVQPSHRRQGCARALLAACENWARAQGCTEFASDCELNNSESLAFHLRIGFSEANRIICFTRKL